MMMRGMAQGASTKASVGSLPAAQSCTPTTMELIMDGPRDTMPANRMMEMPLPMPNSVICSPSHMTKAEPAVKVKTMTMAAQMPFTPAVSMTP